MPLTREKKKEIIEKLKEKTNRQKAIIFTSISGLKTDKISELRRNLKKEDCLLTVVKRTLAEKVFEESNIPWSKKEMTGQLALIFGFKDELSPAKIAYNFSKTNEKLKILGGFFQNSFISPEETEKLAKTPAKEELLRKLVISIKMPIVNFTNILQGNIKGLIYVLAKTKT
jgi:large subunit ribosomal protein L10